MENDDETLIDVLVELQSHHQNMAIVVTETDEAWEELTEILAQHGAIWHHLFHVIYCHGDIIAELTLKNLLPIGCIVTNVRFS